jgi:hypothetical protein
LYEFERRFAGAIALACFKQHHICGQHVNQSKWILIWKKHA